MRELPMPRELNPNVPPAIELVLMRVLSKDRDDRYQSAAELMDAVRSAVKEDVKQVSVLSAGRQSAAESLAKQMVAVPAEPPPLERTVTPTRAAPDADTRKAKKTVPMAAPAAPPQPAKRSYRIELALLGVVLVLILALVALALSERNKEAPVIAPTLAIVQQPTVLITLPPQPTVPPATALPTQPPQRRWESRQWTIEWSAARRRA